MYEDFYRAFEDRYRGSRELIKHRLEVYLPFVLPLHKVYPNSVAIDIGCGRGEWLELLGDNSIRAKGVDIDSGMLDGAKNLDITLGDGIEYLSNEPSNSALVISAFHLVEHISFENLMKLVVEANRVLVEGGILILETPNPENIKVASETFYLDPTHTKPIPSELLSFVTKYHKFKRDKTLRLQEDKSIHNQLYVNVGHIIEGVSPDYSVIAQKNASDDILSILDEPFNVEYGISPLMLVEKFEARLLAMESELSSLNSVNQKQQKEIEQNLSSIKEHAYFIEKTLSIAKVAKDSVNIAQGGVNALMVRIDDTINRVKTAQDGVDYTLQYARDVENFAKHIENFTHSINHNLTIQLNSIKNSFTWRGLSLFERGAKKIKRKLTKVESITTPTIEATSSEPIIVKSIDNLDLKDKSDIEINSKRAEDIYTRLNDAN
jgi:O-antigen chain-terminating methyltransferase